MPIGGDSYNFDGVFDGNGYAIENFILNANQYTFIGFFTQVTGTVRNLTIGGSIVAEAYREASYIGSITAYLAGGRIENCTSKTTIQLNGAAASTLGGIAGVAEDAVIQNCVYEGQMQNNALSNSAYCGGICGYALNSEVSYCANIADLYGFDYIGGILGDAEDHVQISNCYNTGTLAFGERFSSSSHSPGAIGGIVTRVYHGTTLSISSCYNAGVLEGIEQYPSDIGDIIGFTSSKKLIKTVEIIVLNRASLLSYRFRM